MTQATDLGSIANQPGAYYRARVNANIQSAVTFQYGATEPSVMYPNMIWFSSGDGYIKIRNPTNTAWQTIGTIGPPLKWTTSVDFPQELFRTGDIKASYNLYQPGWLQLDDGSIGNSSSGASSRANPDCWDLFSLLWSNTSDDWCWVMYAGTATRSGKGTNALTDWNNQRHISLPRMLGRVPAASGWGAGLSNFYIGTWTGQEYVALTTEQMPAHSHVGPGHAHWRADHGHPYAVDTSSQQSWGSQGQGSFPTGNGDVVAAYAGWPAGTDQTVIGGGGGGWSSWDGASATSTSGASESHLNIPPTTYLPYFIKL